MATQDKINYFEAESSGPLDTLEGKPRADQLVFPLNVAQMDHWLNIRISKQYKFRSQATKKDTEAEKGRTTTQNDKVELKDTKVSIFLPMPAQLSTGYKSNFANEPLGIAGEIAARSGTGTDGNISEVIDQAKNQFSGDSAEILKNIGIAASDSAITNLVGFFGGGLVGAGAAEVGKGIVRGGLASAGITRNPHNALLFQGVDFRTHQLNYKFMPRSAEESKQLKAIITALKYHMSPGLNSGRHIFQYPEVFDIDFHYEKNLFSIAASHLTDFQVNYHGEGTPAYFGPQGDNDKTEVAPVSVELGMTFTETTITTKEEIAKGR